MKPHKQGETINGFYITGVYHDAEIGWFYTVRNVVKGTETTIKHAALESKKG